MENLMPTTSECYYAVTSGIGYPRFSLTEDEGAAILAACEKSGIRGVLLDKIRTIASYTSVKSRYSGRLSIVKME